ncbi:MAG: DUF262 domain-containing protein, partial [Candidatus Kapabacteria bacterium]|nr:DUF262 domain-containing protein [Candidatus Kapabacteria bacterium]
MEIKTILAQIDIGTFALPEFQRGYVWNRDQVRKMITSLYKGYPIGSLLVWTTKTDGATVRGDGAVYPGTVKLILDGQQRITSLYGIIRGVPPKFFDGNSTAFTGLYFNLKEQEFEFFSPLKMKDNPFWINVTELMKSGSGVFIGKIYSLPDVQNDIQKYIDRLNQLDRIKDIDLFIQDVVGEDKTIDVVVDIFNNVNSGGTKLSKGDLALAKICGEWSDARNEMKNLLSKWTKAGFVQSNGNSNEPKDYSFTDKNLSPGKYKYRLKQIDFNGNHNYFDLQNEVNIGIPDKFELSQNYPNPFNPITNLEFGISELGFVSLKVYDVLGKEVKTLVLSLIHIS